LLGHRTEEVTLVKEWLKRLQRKPWVAHLLRAVERFNNRLGSQFGAAITYFSILALVPILLFGFAVLGFVLTVLRPDLINEIVNVFSEALGNLDQATRQKLIDQVSDALSNWRGVGIVALLAAIYSGAGWMGNLRNAVRAQWRPDFDLQEDQGNYLKKTVVNLVTLLGLIVLIAVTFALASISTSLADDVVNFVGLNEVSWLSPLLRIVPIIFSIGAGWLLFMYLFTVLPESREPWPVVRRGALMGAIGLGVLQYSTGLLFSLFARNRAASIFGPVIVLMLFFNIFAQLILFIAAWIATANQEAVPTPEEKVRFPLTAEQSGAAETGASTSDGSVMIPQPVAARSVQVGLGAGYVTGTATGVGLGAALAWLLSKAVRGRR
jgi:membrane protein